MDDRTHYLELAAASVRGTLGLGLDVQTEEAVARGLDEGLRLHKFKRNAELPRVRAVLGVLRGMAPMSVLDVGSGRGAFLWPLLDAFPGLEVTAIDVRRSRARELAAVGRGGELGLTGLQMDAAAMSFGPESFDVVTILEVLEHLERPELAAAEAARVARRAVIASAPSKPDTNADHIQLFDARSLRALLIDAGVTRASVDGVRGHLIAVGTR